MTSELPPSDRGGFVASKADFATLLKDKTPCLMDASESRGELRARIAYDCAVDRITFDHYERKRLAVLIHDVVEHNIVTLNWWGKLRLTVVGLLCPGISQHFHHVATLAAEYEAKLKPLLK